MAQQGHTDKQIAAHLTHAGHRSPRAGTFLQSTVAGLRYRLGIHHQESHGSPHTIERYLRPNQLAKLLQIRPHWLYDRIRNGTIKIAKHPQSQTVLFPDEPETIQKNRRLLSGEVKTLAF